MSTRQRKAVSAYRRRMKGRGFVRLEVQVREDDAVLLREVASALSDPDREAEARALLRERFAGRTAPGLKALLASAPLDGIDLERTRDRARVVDL